jgi:acyl carrier protein phosphodiesterase
MNWLAHVLLSEPNPAFRLGNLLPDLAAAPLLADLPAEYQRGIRRHRQIDAFTDSHGVFRRSVQRLEPPYRRFGGILVDVFYDHFLTSEWHRHSDQPLPEFLAEVYSSFEVHRGVIPAEAYAALQRMQADNWLGSYGDMAGLTLTFRRINNRLRRPFDLSPAVALLERDYELYQADFAQFFPELVAQVASVPVATS